VDITERKQTEKILRITAVAFESSQALMVSDVDRPILRIDPPFIELGGYRRAHRR